MKLIIIYFQILLLFYPYKKAEAQTIKLTDKNDVLNISSKFFIFEDVTSKLPFNEILNEEFTLTKQATPNFGISSSVFWVKFTLENRSSDEHFLLNLSLSSLDYVYFYFPTDSGYQFIETGEHLIFNTRKYKDPNYIFDILIPKNQTQIYFLEIHSKEGIQLPISIGKEGSIYYSMKKKDLLSGIYFGVMLVMILYNLFIYFSVRDKSYLFYVVYILCILLTQTSLQGYTFQYLWPNLPIIAQYSLFVLPALSGITGMFFMNIFLKTYEYFKSSTLISYILTIPYIISVTLSFFGQFKLSQTTMEANAVLVSFYLLAAGIIVYRKGYQPAKYFLAAWITFLLGVIIFILKDFEILPYNNFTRYTMQIGSAIETVLLSFALATRINEYKKEKELSQKQAFAVLEEKEQFVREQNVLLEQKVELRTHELNETLEHLKNTQSQLVDAEKMSSLGQLTAGIAHEINNPINFISSNIPPLKQDINDLNAIINKYEELCSSSNLAHQFIEVEELKQQLDYNYLKTELTTIIGGIENGAQRTTEIVRGLKNFSRLDENDLLLADINEGIISTLALVNSISTNILIKKNLAPLPKIECYPGKLNQVFMNLLNNAIQAINSNQTRAEKGVLKLETYEEDKHIKIIISDNGIGIKDEIIDKIFDPFFTTKDVGKGTGLGLSIVYRIIEKHNGKIEVSSKINEGTTFIITLTKVQETKNK